MMKIIKLQYYYLQCLLRSFCSDRTKYLIVLLVYMVLHVFLVFGEPGITLPRNITIPALIVFGDSIVDQGSNNHLSTLVKCNFSPYGKDFMSGIPTGRFSNAKTPPDMIVEDLGIKEYLPSYLDPNLRPQDLPTGVSFASGGSGFDPQTPKLVSVVSLSDQMASFKEYIGKLTTLVGAEGTNHILSNSLFLVVAGSDDLANTYFTIGARRLQYDISSYADLLVAQASDFIQELCKLGARRVGVFGIPPIGCMPSQRTLAGGSLRVCAENYNQAAQLVNSKLSSELDSLGRRLSPAKVIYVDIYKPLLDIIQNPLNYGFAVVDKGCCGTGTLEAAVLCNKASSTCPDDTKYLFWDSYHPTERGYRILVDQILQAYVEKLL